MKKILIASLLASTLTGCAGVIAVQEHNITRTPPTKQGWTPDVCPGTEVGKFAHCGYAATKEEFRQAWGDPASVKQDGENEVWQYNRDVAWRGVVVGAIIIPLPLVAPTGFNHETLTFGPDGKLINSVSEIGGPGAAVGCMYWPLANDQFGCFAEGNSK